MDKELKDNLREEFMQKCFFTDNTGFDITGLQAKSICNWFTSKLETILEEARNEEFTAGQKMGVLAFKRKLIEEIEAQKFNRVLKNKEMIYEKNGLTVGQVAGENYNNALDQGISLIKNKGENI